MTGYRILVRGELSGTLAEAFSDLRVEAALGRTVLSGEVVDQAQLHGIIDRLRAFGIELEAVTPSDRENPEVGR